MKLNKLEQELLKHFLKKENIKFSNQFNFEKIKVSKRNITGVGFLTYIEKTNLLRIIEQKKSFKYGKIGAKLNYDIEVGFLIYIDEGYIMTIEGYTYDVAWPNKIEKIEFYEIK